MTDDKDPAVAKGMMNSLTLNKSPFAEMMDSFVIDMNLEMTENLSNSFKNVKSNVSEYSNNDCHFNENTINEPDKINLDKILTEITYL